MAKYNIESNDIHKSASAPQLASESYNKVGKYEKDDLWKPETVKKPTFNEKKSNLKNSISDSDEEVARLTQKQDTSMYLKHIVIFLLFWTLKYFLKNRYFYSMIIF